MQYSRPLESLGDYKSVPLCLNASPHSKSQSLQNLPHRRRYNLQQRLSITIWTGHSCFKRYFIKFSSEGIFEILRKRIIQLFHISIL